MSTEIGHGSFHRRIAINVGAGYVPGINAVITGAAMAAGRMGWEMVGIRDGFEGCYTGNTTPTADWLPSVPNWLKTSIRLRGGSLDNRPGLIPSMYES